MGTCQNTSKKLNKSQIIPGTTMDLINSLFADMPEWGGERYRGEGIKKMKGYKCEIPIDELNKIREEFWGYKINKNLIWKQIKQAVLMDAERGAKYLETLKLKPVNGCINELKDKKGKIFKIPNYCINDPYFEKIFEDDSEYETNYREGKLIKIKLFDFYQGDKKNYEVEVNDNLLGRELKLIFCRKEKIDDGEVDNIRLFFGGSEILDNHRLYKHNLMNDYTILAMVRQKTPIVQ